jgi:Tol biopolymer transport system component
VDPTTGVQFALSHDWRWADIEPAVSPDGKHIAFARGRAQAHGSQTRLTPVELIASRHLFLMGAPGGPPHRLTNAPGWTDEVPVWSPDGPWLFFVRWRRHHPDEAAEAALWTVRTDGTNPQRIARLNVPAGFLNGFGYYGSFGWKGLFDVAP